MMSFFRQHMSAWLPPAMSFVMFVILLMFLFVLGVQTREADEGVGAHLFQIWLVLEVFTVGFFALRWLSEKPKEALPILLIQILAVLAVCSPVFLLNL